MQDRIRVLVVDDQESMCETLEILFQRAGYHVETCPGGREAIDRIREGPPFDLVITDLVMPGVDGMEVLESTRAIDPHAQVVMITAHSTTSAAVDAMKLGAYDYIQKPFSMNEMRITAEKALEKGRLLRENVQLRRRMAGMPSFEDVVGESPGLMAVVERLERVAAVPTNVLISGESGTGKELMARALHTASPRAPAPFVVVDCGAIPESLMESELFGHVKGAFTGAVGTKEGLVKSADTGTLFLDEIGELPLALQVKLLRMLQERTIKPVGSVDLIPVDVRIVAATNRPLQDAVERGEFRSDLYYRLNVIQVEIPPLRERREDIPLLARHFAELFANRFSKPIRGFEEAAMDHLMEQAWPGNVRELSNVVESSVALESTEEIRLETIHDGLAPREHIVALDTRDRATLEERIGQTGIDGVLGALEKSILDTYWKKHGGNRQSMADDLGITVRSLRYRLSKYGIGSTDRES